MPIVIASLEMCNLKGAPGQICQIWAIDKLEVVRSVLCMVGVLLRRLPTRIPGD